MIWILPIHAEPADFTDRCVLDRSAQRDRPISRARRPISRTLPTSRWAAGTDRPCTLTDRWHALTGRPPGSTGRHAALTSHEPVRRPGRTPLSERPSGLAGVESPGGLLEWRFVQDGRWICPAPHDCCSGRWPTADTFRSKAARAKRRWAGGGARHNDAIV